jgi:prophage regulatory protein
VVYRRPGICDHSNARPDPEARNIDAKFLQNDTRQAQRVRQSPASALTVLNPDRPCHRSGRQCVGCQQLGPPNPETISLEPVDPRALLRLKQVLRLCPIGASTWWEGVRSGRFPKPVKLGPKTTAWRASDVLALIDSLPNDGALTANNRDLQIVDSSLTAQCFGQERNVRKLFGGKLNSKRRHRIIRLQLDDSHQLGQNTLVFCRLSGPRFLWSAPQPG